MLDLQDVIGAPLDGMSDRMPMGRSENKGLKDQHIECPLQHVSVGLRRFWHEPACILLHMTV